MLYKKGYLVHFARLFFASLLLGICSFVSHIWRTYQPFYLAIQLQRCQSTLSNVNIWNWLNNFHLIDLLPSISFFSKSISSKCQLYIQNDYPLNIDKSIRFIHSILLIYLIYHLICLSFFSCKIPTIPSQTKILCSSLSRRSYIPVR